MNTIGELLMLFVWLLMGVVSGAVITCGAAERHMERSARAGVMIIDGTAYVLVPAKRGVE